MPAPIAGLSPEQLCVIIEARAGASDAALRVAEEHAAWLVEQPEWVLSEVLLSPDLAPHILAQLPTKDHAVKGTCRAWRRGWKETLKKRERPRMLVIGGEGSDGEFVNSIERYDPRTTEWEEEAAAPMPIRLFVRTAMLDGKLYAVGGQSEDGATLLGGAARSRDERVGGGGANGDTTRDSRHGGARRQAVRCGRRARRRLPQLGGAVRPGSEHVGGGGAAGDGAGLSRSCLDVDVCSRTRIDAWQVGVFDLTPGVQSVTSRRGA